MPIRMKSVVQTVGKAQFGGVNAGLFIVRYHVLTDSCVRKPPKAPTLMGISKLTTNAGKLNFTVCAAVAICLLLKLPGYYIGAKHPQYREPILFIDLYN